MKDRSMGIHGIVCGDAEIRRTERAPFFLRKMERRNENEKHS